MPEIFCEKYICVVCSKRQSKFRCGRCHSVTYCGRECQKKDLKRHKKLCAPVVYKKFDERGRGLMATKDFKQGDIVFKDKASITLQHDNHQSKIERGNALIDQFHDLLKDDQKRFLMLKSDEKAIDLLQDELKNHLEDESKVTKLKSHFLHFGIFENNFYQTIRKTREHKVLWYDNIFLTMSSTTHSCFPNAEIQKCNDDAQAVEIKAKTDIKEGEEITIDYLLIASNLKDNSKFLTRSRRHEIINSKDFNCPCPESIVISGNGNTAGQCLGLYQWDPKYKCYKQFSTEPYWNHPQESTDKFLYKTLNGNWIVGVGLGVCSGWLWNSSKSSSIPQSGWMDMNKQMEPSIKIEFRELTKEDVSDKIIITLRGQVAEEWPKCGGEFVKTWKYYSGKPIFINSHGYYLFSDDMAGWSIGEEMFRSRVYSTSAALSPASSKSWFSDGEADVGVSEVLD